MDFLKKYQRHLSGVAFIVGFVVDYLFAPRIDNPYIPAVLSVYILLAGGSILFEQIFARAPSNKRTLIFLARVAPALTQLIFGATMSILFVYYSRSATLVGSWPFMLLLGVMFFGNEIFHERVRIFKFQLATFFFVFFMATNLAVPIVLHKLGVMTFLFSGGLSLLVMLLFIGSISAFSQKIIRENAFGVFAMTFGMYLLINILYFAHLIPPIPLLLRDSGVYHSITRDVGGDYLGFKEPQLTGKWYAGSQTTLHLFPGEPIYFYSAVFAPTTIETPIVHTWQRKDANTGDWITAHRTSFPIVGGRDGGYRGYSIKENIIPGVWRVSVETAGGELLGRETFTIEITEKPPVLIETVLK